jgi:hypothetical protein
MPCALSTGGVSPARTGRTVAARRRAAGRRAALRDGAFGVGVGLLLRSLAISEMCDGSVKANHLAPRAVPEVEPRQFRRGHGTLPA